MSTFDIRNLNLPQVGVTTEDGTVATSTPTAVGTPTPVIQNPFAVGFVAASTSVDLPNGTSLRLPNLTQDDVSQVNSLFGGMSAESLDQVHKASQRLAKALFAAVTQNPDSTNAVTGAAFASGGAASAGGGTAAQTASQRVDNLTASFYQTLSQTQMNVQPEDGSDDDSDDDDNDDNSWGTTGSIPQLQNQNQNLLASPTLQLSNLVQQAGVSTGVAAATGSGDITSTQNKLLANNSPNQAPLVSSGTPEVYSAAANAVQVYQQGQQASADAALVSSGYAAVSTGSYDGAVNAVTYMGIIGLQQQLGEYAQDTQSQLNQLNAARQEYSEVDQAVAAWPAGQQTESFTYTIFNSNGGAATTTATLDYNGAAALKDTLEQQVNGMSDTNQEKQLELQNLTQSYSEAINTMSNLLKMNFDTVKAVINNIRS